VVRVLALALAATTAFLLVQPNGAASPTGWAIVTSPAGDGSVNNILIGSACATALQCFGVGVVIQDQGGVSALIDQWNGSSWVTASGALPPAGLNYALLGVTCVTATSCWAAGAEIGGPNGNPVAPLTEHWDGTSWSATADPLPAGALGAIFEGVGCASVDDCWAVGFTSDDTGGALKSLTEHWDGSTWSVVASAPTGQSYDQLNSVSCTSSSDCWAVGTGGAQQQNPAFLPIYPAAAGDQGLVEHWDGSTWSVVPSVTTPAPGGGYLSSVDCVSAAFCWASGATTGSAGAADSTLMERWNGTSWAAVPTPDPAGQARDILSSVTCVDDDDCWAVGISGAKGQGGDGVQFRPQAFIQGWDGSTWSFQPSPSVTASSLLGSVSCVRGAMCFSVGAALTIVPSGDGLYQSLVEQLTLPPSSNQGLVAAASDGGIFAFGNARFFGSMGGQALNRPVVGIASTPDGGGYWEVASDGGIFAFGDARFFGSMGGQALNRPVVGIAATPDGRGYWEVASDGGIFAFGDARFYGSMGGQALNRPVVGIAATPDGGGYWEVASDGGIFAFGDARFHGSGGGAPLNRPITGLATTPNGRGYWMVAADGGVFAFGNADYFGSVPGQGIVAPATVVGITPTPDGQGYWEAGANGTVYTYGNAAFLGSLAGLSLAAPLVGVAAS
jgi:hypothetical protein